VRRYHHAASADGECFEGQRVGLQIEDLHLVVRNGKARYPAGKVNFTLPSQGAVVKTWGDVADMIPLGNARIGYG
jgi:hypothetical protein